MESREIIVTDLTRLREPNVCLAGIDCETGELLRPLHNNRDYLSEQECINKNIYTGCLIKADFGDFKHTPQPHTEDINWNKNTCQQKTTSSIHFLNVLNYNLSPTMDEGFGVPINDKVIQGNDANPPQTRQSIITLRPKLIEIVINEFHKLRCHIGDDNILLRYLSITDLNIINTINTQSEIDELNRKIHQSPNHFVRIGLSRYHEATDGRKGYWLQINGIYVFDGQGNRIV